MSDVQELTENTQKSPWGNDEIVLDVKDVIGLLQGKKYFYFDGEYGHTILVDFEEDENS